MHSRKTKQANKILLRENDSVISDKQQIADIFNDHFVHIAKGAPEINVRDFGEDFTEHPSVITIQDNTREVDLLFTSSTFNTPTKHKLSSFFPVSTLERLAVMI